MTSRIASGALTAWLVGALLAGCHKPSLPPSHSPGTAACGDPCAAMVCPSGDRCSWNDNCQPRCEPQPLSPAFGH